MPGCGRSMLWMSWPSSTWNANGSEASGLARCCDGALPCCCMTIPTGLFLFYRISRATLRARLAIAHMLDPKPRTPEKWPRLARTYLAIARIDALKLERLLASHA